MIRSTSSRNSRYFGGSCALRSLTSFRESFRLKSPLEGLLAKIPVRAVREPRLGLIGAAEAAYRTAIETTR